MPLAALTLLLLTASPALAQDTTPGGDPSVGFPVALAVIAFVATIVALTWRAASKRKDRR